MADCIFCAIVAGTAPAEIVYDDSSCIGILDINPATTGHSLIIPRDHHDDLFSLPEDLAADSIRAAQKLAAAIDAALRPDGMNLVQANGKAGWQTVFHFHLHVVPRYENDGLVPPWRLGHAGNRDELRETAAKIRRQVTVPNE